MEDITILKKINFFQDLKSNEILQINKITERKAFKAGEVIVKEGTVCDAFYIIKSGLVKVERAEHEFARFGKDEAIGEISFIDKGLRSATVVAVEDTVLIKISSDAFEKLLVKEKDIANKVYKAIAIILCRRLRESNEFLKLIQL